MPLTRRSASRRLYPARSARKSSSSAARLSRFASRPEPIPSLTANRYFPADSRSHAEPSPETCSPAAVAHARPTTTRSAGFSLNSIHSSPLRRHSIFAPTAAPSAVSSRAVFVSLSHATFSHMCSRPSSTHTLIASGRPRSAGIAVQTASRARSAVPSSPSICSQTEKSVRACASSCSAIQARFSFSRALSCSCCTFCPTSAAASGYISAPRRQPNACTARRTASSAPRPSRPAHAVSAPSISRSDSSRRASQHSRCRSHPVHRRQASSSTGGISSSAACAGRSRVISESARARSRSTYVIAAQAPPERNRACGCSSPRSASSHVCGSTANTSAASRMGGSCSTTPSSPEASSTSALTPKPAPAAHSQRVPLPSSPASAPSAHKYSIPHGCPPENACKSPSSTPAAAASPGPAQYPAASTHSAASIPPRLHPRTRTHSSPIETDAHRSSRQSLSSEESA